MGSQSMVDSDYYDDHHTPENKSESFVVDLENFGNSTNAIYLDDPIPTPSTTTAGNSRLITLQRNLSRKGSFNTNRGNSSDNRKSADRDNSNGLLASSSPKGFPIPLRFRRRDDPIFYFRRYITGSNSS